jgi:hypothetical protein
MRFEIAQLGNGIVRNVIDHRYRHHCGQTTRHTALEEEVEANLRLVAVYLALFSVPWIDRRAQRRRLLLVCSVPQQVMETSFLRGRAQLDLFDRISYAISRIPGSMYVART